MTARGVAFKPAGPAAARLRIAGPAATRRPAVRSASRGRRVSPACPQFQRPAQVAARRGGRGLLRPWGRAWENAPGRGDRELLTAVCHM